MAFAFVLCLSGLFTQVSAAAAGSTGLQQVLAKAQNSVATVWVVGYGSGGAVMGAESGSGFAVGQAGKDTDIFLTNWHVVTLDGNFSTENVRVWLLKENCAIQSNYEPDPNNSIECRVLKTTSGYPDYAVIKMQKAAPGYKALPLLSAKKIEKGTQVYALGFPGIVEAYSVERFGGTNLTATDGIVSRHGQLSFAGNTSVLFHTAKISSGNSGGPLITKDGAVVGINTYGIGDESADYSCAIYIDYAMEGLDELGIAYTVYSGTMTIILAVAAAAVVIACAVIFCLYRKKNNEKIAIENERQKQQDEERKRIAEEEKKAEEKRRIDAISREIKEIKQENRFKLLCDNGVTYSVTAPETVIGRDPGCQICLPESTKGVSRKHCKLTLQGENLLLLDPGSSFGTFVHGQKIPVNTFVKLHAGSSFCLGGPNSNKFTVL